MPLLHPVIALVLAAGLLSACTYDAAPSKFAHDLGKTATDVQPIDFFVIH